jgi:hypothetical protein
MGAKSSRESKGSGWEDFAGVRRTSWQARMGFDKHGHRIARRYQLVKYFTVNGKN